MDNQKFVAQVRHLHEDVRYMFIRAMKLTDKSILNLEKSEDYLKCCCQKLAEALLMVTQNTTQYARELEKYIRGIAPEIEYRDTLELLMLITLNREPVKALGNEILAQSNISSEELNNFQNLFDQATVTNTPPNPNELNISEINNLPEKEREPDKQSIDSDLEIVSWLVPSGSSSHTASDLEKDELNNSTDLSTFSQETVIYEMKNSNQKFPNMFIAKEVENVPQNGDSDATDWDGDDLGRPPEEQLSSSQVFSLNQSEEGLSCDELEEGGLWDQKRAFLFDLGLTPKLKPKLIAINRDTEQSSTTPPLATTDNMELPTTAFSENVSQLSSSTEVSHHSGSESMQLHKTLDKELRNSLFAVIKKYFQKRQGQPLIDSSSSDNEPETREIELPKRKCRHKRKHTENAQQSMSALNEEVSEKEINGEDKVDLEATQAANLTLLKDSCENILKEEEIESEVSGPLEGTKLCPLPINRNPVSSSPDLDSEGEASHLTKAELSFKSKEDIKGGPKRLRSSSESSLDSTKLTPSAKKSRLSSESLLLDSEGRDGLVQLLDEHQLMVELGALRMSRDNSSDAQIVSIKPACIPIKETKHSDNIEGVGANYWGELSANLNLQSTTCNENLCDGGLISPVKFELNDGDRDELLDLLTKHLEIHKPDKNNLDTSNINPEIARPNANKKTLLGLIEEFEEAINKETGSDTESCLMDILREETVIESSQPMDKSDKRSRNHDKEAWEAFQALMAEDEDLSSSSSCSDLSEKRFWSCRGRNKALTEELRKEFGIDRDLFVNVECLSNSVLDMSEYKERRESSVIERLCNLGNILHMNKGHKSSRRLNTRKHTVSLTSSSCSELNSLTDDRESTPILVSEEERDMPASLWDNIKNSSDEECLSVGSDKEDKKQKSEEDEVTSATGKSSEIGYRNDKTVVLDSSDEEDFVGVRKSRPAWRQDPLLNASISFSSDSEAESLKKREIRRKEINLDESHRHRKVKKKKKQHPIKTFLVESDTTTDDSDFEIISVQKKMLMPQTVITLSDEDVPSTKSKGRRNIRALVEDEDLAEATQRANTEERERIRRLQERDKAKESFTQSFLTQGNDIDIDPLILDVYEDTQIRVHPKITRKLKPHQREGVQFMWDSCYESVKQLKENKYSGSGGILAHCMGLGKTLQALALIQAVFNNPITKTKHVLVVCPLSTVSNWKNEYKLAYKGIKDPGVKFHSIEVTSQAQLRFDTVNKWRDQSGMLVMGYECFGLLVNEQKLIKWEKNCNFRKEDILKALVDPGPDLVICDEGHLLRNQQSQRTLALSKIKTKRRIILTGTPLQNNLLEYYYMVNFVKPCLLGTEKEYKTNFVNPIHNGQYEDSTADDIMFMKKRTHVLHKILISTVQRVEDTELKRYLPKLVDQAVFIKLSDLQVQLYNTYLDSTNSQLPVYTKKGQICRSSFLADVQMLQYICLHPNVLCTAEQKARAKATVKEQDVIDDNLVDELEESQFARFGRVKDLLSSKKTNELSMGTKLEVAVSIVRESETCGDKVLIFSQSHAEMDNLEYFLQKNLNYKNKRDYYRMDGTVSPALRSHMCSKFNDPKNKSIKVFIMSKKVGGLGLNLTAANRVIIMNVSWNPSYDTQSVFRAFRFGQDKAVFVYRLIAIDTMEEKMYQRVVTKLAIAHRVVDKHQITRHYSSADIQEFYSVRPTADEERPVPNVPEDRILAKIIQTHKHLFRWHEHQALLANRPEEDLDEQQKNAAWEEFNKMPAPESGPAVLNQCSSTSMQSNASNYFGPMQSGSPALPDHTYSRPNSESHPLTCYPSFDDFMPPPLRRSRCQSHRYLKLPIRGPVCTNQRMTLAEEFNPGPRLRNSATRHLFEERSNKTPTVVTSMGHAPALLESCLTNTREEPSVVHSQKPHIRLQRQGGVEAQIDKAKNIVAVRIKNIKLRNKVLGPNVQKILNNQIRNSIYSIKKEGKKEKHEAASGMQVQADVNRFLPTPRPAIEKRKGYTPKSPFISNNSTLISPVANERPKEDIFKALPTANLLKQIPSYGKEEHELYLPKTTPTTDNFELASLTGERNKPDISITPLTTNQQRHVEPDPSRLDTQSPMQKRVRNFMEHLHLLQTPWNANSDENLQNKCDPPLKVARDLSEFKLAPATKITSDLASKKFVRVKPFYKLAPFPNSRFDKRSINTPPAVPVHVEAKISSSSAQKPPNGITRPSTGPLEKHLTRNQNKFSLGPFTTRSLPKSVFQQFVPVSPSKSNKENKSLQSPANLTSDEVLNGPYRSHRELLDALKKKGVSVDVGKPASGAT
ncbi:transcriptional regulator ATRX-like isoform X2 [Euwallacea fornicatus]|uniref:transcriptional regulator ATRX-like isoform X2 n=1 Tax=Euwallacea fornicatus TaxID=995702 RepID=UPI00338FD01D